MFARSGEGWAPQATLVVEGHEGFFGGSVALSADGDTALIGSEYANGGHGAAWVFSRSGETWTLQAKLNGSGAVGASHFGADVALSSDGNVALIGGPKDKPAKEKPCRDECPEPPAHGAVWLFTREGSTWSNGTRYVGKAGESLGRSVALSAEGGTALVGGRRLWAFTVSGSKLEQPQKLSAPEADSTFGYSVALDGNGSGALVGSPCNRLNCDGAVWAYSRLGSSWSRGEALTGGGEEGEGYFGEHLGLSSEGSTALIAGQNSAWFFTHSGGRWTQQCERLRLDPGAGYVGAEVALSADGSTALLAAPFDEDGTVWAYISSDSSCT